MKRDDMILAGAVLFAGALVAQKSGLFKSMSLKSIAPTFASWTPFTGTNGKAGYNPANPGQYLMVDDLLAGATEGDWSYTPTFDQTVDSVLGSSSNTGSVIKVKTPW